MFRSKPILIDAIKVSTADIDALTTWLGDTITGDIAVTLSITTRYGTVNVTDGDYIVRGDDGYYRTSDPATFEAKYDPA